jgi:hypothetical protein
VGLEVELIGEPPPGLEVAVQEAVVALERAPGLAIPGIEQDPAVGEGAAEGGELLDRAPVPGVDRALPVPHRLLGSAPSRARQRLIPSDVRELLGEDECAAEAPRVGQLAGDHIAPARLAEADRNLAQRLGQVKLGQLAGTVDGALKGPGRRPVAGPELAQQVVEDRLPPQ